MTLFSATIVASTDDAQESGGTVTVNGSNVNCSGSSQYIGLRFQNVTIPAGSTINTATVDVNLPSGSFDDPDLTIHCEDTDDAAAFTTSTNDISGRPRTTANTTWTTTGLGTGIKTSPDFAAAVQEVIDRGGWASGNDLVVIMKGNSGASSFRISAYDGGGSNYATINIDYTAGGGGGGQPPRSMHQFRQRGN